MADQSAAYEIAFKLYFVPMLDPIKLATIARQLINIADPPAPNNTAIGKISYCAVSHFSQPNKTQIHPPGGNKNMVIRVRHWYG